MQLFLCSKGLITEEMTDHFLAFAGPLRNISLITTASTDFKEKNKNTVALSQKLNSQRFSVSYVDVEYDSPDVLKAAELIIIQGGNPYYLLFHLKKSGADKVLIDLIKKDVPVMGISAGLLVLTKSLAIIDVLTPEMNTLELKDKSCLGLIEETVVPHYDRFVQEGKIRKEDIDAFEQNLPNQVIKLGEYQALIYQEGERKIIGGWMS